MAAARGELDAILAWASQEGVTWSPKVRFAFRPDGPVLGWAVEAAEPLEEGELLLEVPAAACIAAPSVVDHAAMLARGTAGPYWGLLPAPADVDARFPLMWDAGLRAARLARTSTLLLLEAMESAADEVWAVFQFLDFLDRCGMKLCTNILRKLSNFFRFL